MHIGSCGAMFAPVMALAEDSLPAMMLHLPRQDWRKHANYSWGVCAYASNLVNTGGRYVEFVINVSSHGMSWLQIY